MDKQFVDVVCDHYPDGAVRPLRIAWPDGRTFEIKRTLHVAAPSDHEYEGIRYTVLIGSAEKYLYRTGSKWYVQPVHAEVDTS